MTFQGFGPQALPFFTALAFHQTKEWFEANREIYETEIKGPLGDLVEDVVQRLAKAKDSDQRGPEVVRLPHSSRCPFLQQQRPLQDQRRNRAEPQRIEE